MEEPDEWILEATPEGWIDYYVGFTQAGIEQAFAENSAEERLAFFETWNSDAARNARARHRMGGSSSPRGSLSPRELQHLIFLRRYFSSSGWPWHDLAKWDAGIFRLQALENLQNAGESILRILERKDGVALRFLADVLDGKVEAPLPRSGWRDNVLTAFHGLCKGAEYAKLPTKAALRECLSSKVGFDEKRFRDILRELGLNGLPRAKPGPKKTGG